MDEATHVKWDGAQEAQASGRSVHDPDDSHGARHLGDDEPSLALGQSAVGGARRARHQLRDLGLAGAGEDRRDPSDGRVLEHGAAGGQEEHRTEHLG